MIGLRQLIEQSLMEDIGHADITSVYLELDKVRASAFLVSKDEGVLAGLHIAEQVFATVDPGLVFVAYKKDGDKLKKGDEIAKITGSSGSILRGERVALNFLQRLCGTATLTRKMVDRIRPHKARLLDTRKTTPLLRELQKYAVRVGGGYNHRFGLYDFILVKENHIRAAGSITEAVKRIRKHNTSYLMEVEVTDHQELQEAIACEVDRIMLDNMSLADIRKSVEIAAGRIPLEVSGGVNIDTIQQIAATGVDYISVGAITHSVPAFDISLLFKE